MKNAYVIQHHWGDDGNAPEGRILRSVTTARFDALVKAGLVREATAEEVQRGGDVPFEETALDAPEAGLSPPPAAPDGGASAAAEPDGGAPTAEPEADAGDQGEKAAEKPTNKAAAKAANKAN